MTDKQKSAMARAWLTLEPRLIDIGHMASLASVMDELDIDERTAFIVHHLDRMVEALIAECRAAHQECSQ